MLRHNLMSPQEPTPQPAPRTPYDWLKDFFVPLLLAGVGVARHEVLWYLGAAAFVIVALAVGAATPALRAARLSRAQARDGRRAKEGHAEFRRFVARLGEFVDINRSERLEEIVNRRLVERVPAARGRTLTAPQRVFYSMWNLLERRTTLTPHDITAALANWDDFFTVLNDFEREHVRPVFQNLPPDLREALDDAARSDLNAYREQFNSFLDDYRKYLKRFFDSLESVRRDAPHFDHLKPLP